MKTKRLSHRHKQNKNPRERWGAIEQRAEEEGGGKVDKIYERRRRRGKRKTKLGQKNGALLFMGTIKGYWWTMFSLERKKCSKEIFFTFASKKGTKKAYKKRPYFYLCFAAKNELCVGEVIVNWGYRMVISYLFLFNIIFWWYNGWKVILQFINDF